MHESKIPTSTEYVEGMIVQYAENELGYLVAVRQNDYITIGVRINIHEDNSFSINQTTIARDLLFRICYRSTHDLIKLVDVTLSDFQVVTTD